MYLWDPGMLLSSAPSLGRLEDANAKAVARVERILPSEANDEFATVSVWVAQIEPQKANQLIKELGTASPLVGLEHVKRVKRTSLEGPPGVGGPRLEVILCRCETVADSTSLNSASLNSASLNSASGLTPARAHSETPKTDIALKTDFPLKTEISSKTEIPLKIEIPLKTDIPLKTEISLKTEQPSRGMSSPVLSPALEEITQKLQLHPFLAEVPAHAAATKAQWRNQCKIWPTSFHPNSLQSLEQQQAQLSEAEKEYAVRHMRAALEQAEWAAARGLPGNAALVVDPHSSAVLAAACDTSRPLKHGHDFTTTGMTSASTAGNRSRVPSSTQSRCQDCSVDHRSSCGSESQTKISSVHFGDTVSGANGALGVPRDSQRKMQDDTVCTLQEAEDGGLGSYSCKECGIPRESQRPQLLSMRFRSNHPIFALEKNVRCRCSPDLPGGQTRDAGCSCPTSSNEKHPNERGAALGSSWHPLKHAVISAMDAAAARDQTLYPLFGAKAQAKSQGQGELQLQIQIQGQVEDQAQTGTQTQAQVEIIAQERGERAAEGAEVDGLCGDLPKDCKRAKRETTSQLADEAHHSQLHNMEESKPAHIEQSGQREGSISYLQSGLPKPYLCTGMDAFVVQEPCSMCAMALVHQRFRRIFFANTTRGGSFCSLPRIHGVKELNHHFDVYRVFMP